MPSPNDATSSPAPSSNPPAPAEAPASPALALAQASRALWLATLALMTAYMHNAAPAHRLLLARRIAANLQTLAVQDCFGSRCRGSFARLARRWQARADQLAPQGPSRRRGLPQALS